MTIEKRRERLTELLAKHNVEDTFLEPMLVSAELYLTAYAAAKMILENVPGPMHAAEMDECIHSIAVALMGNIQIVVRAEPQGLSVADSNLVKQLQEMHGIKGGQR